MRKLLLSLLLALPLAAAPSLSADSAVVLIYQNRGASAPTCGNTFNFSQACNSQYIGAL